MPSRCSPGNSFLVKSLAPSSNTRRGWSRRLQEKRHAPTDSIRPVRRACRQEGRRTFRYRSERSLWRRLDCRERSPAYRTPGRVELPLTSHGIGPAFVRPALTRSNSVSLRIGAGSFMLSSAADPRGPLHKPCRCCAAERVAYSLLRNPGTPPLPVGQTPS